MTISKIKQISILAIQCWISVLQSAEAFTVISFNGKYARWDKKEVRYTIDLKGSDNFSGNATTGCDKEGVCVTLQKAIENSFDTWEKTQGINLTFVENAPSNITNPEKVDGNLVTWVEKDWRAMSFRPPSEALAVTISTYRTDNAVLQTSKTYFNGEYFDWAVINTPQEESGNVIDIQNIATHEIGHFIGLDHSSNDAFENNLKLFYATMFFASGPGETFRRELKDDDRAAGLSLYPSASPDEPVIESITPETLDASMDKNTPVTIRGRNFSDTATALLATTDGKGDVIGRIISSSDSELTVTFDVMTLPSGKYDLMVANSYDRSDRLSKGLAVTGGAPSISNGSYTDSTSAGGCALTGDAENWMGTLTGILILVFPMLLVLTSRLALSPKRERVKANSESRLTKREP